MRLPDKLLWTNLRHLTRFAVRIKSEWNYIHIGPNLLSFWLVIMEISPQVLPFFNQLLYVSLSQHNSGAPQESCSNDKLRHTKKEKKSFLMVCCYSDDGGKLAAYTHANSLLPQFLDSWKFYIPRDCFLFNFKVQQILSR